MTALWLEEDASSIRTANLLDDAIMLLTILLCISLATGMLYYLCCTVTWMKYWAHVYTIQFLQLNEALMIRKGSVLFGQMVGCSKHSFSFLHVGISHSLHCILNGSFVLLLCHLHSLTVGLGQSMFPHLIPQGWQTICSTSLARHLNFKVHPFSWEWYTLLLLDANGAHTATDQTSCEA